MIEGSNVWSVLLTLEVDGVSAIDRDFLRVRVDQMSRHIPFERIIVACSRSNITQVSRALTQIPEQNFVVAPIDKGSAPLVALINSLIMRIGEAATVIALPVDLPVGPQELWIGRAVSLVGAPILTTGIVLIGDTSVVSSSRFGHSKVTTSTEFELHRIEAIDFGRELPGSISTSTAVVWDNTGVMVWTSEWFLNTLLTYDPELASIHRLTNEDWQRYDFEKVIGNWWLRTHTRNESVWQAVARYIGQGARGSILGTGD